MGRSRRFGAALWALAVLGCGGGNGGADGSPAVDLADTPADAVASSTPDSGAAGADLGFLEAPHLDWPQVTPHSGRVLKPMRLVTIASTGDPLATQLFAFGDALVKSNWWAAIGADYGLGAAGDSVHVTGPAITSGTQMDQAAIANYISAACTGANAPDGHTMFMLYLPDGVDLVYQGSVNTNCQNVGGYHRAYGTGGDGWGVSQRCPMRPGRTLLDDQTSTGSHEVAEGATDTGNGWAITLPAGMQPWMGSIWLEDEGNSHVEVGDLCGGSRIVEAGFTYARIFSNTAAKLGGDPCVPALTLPYYAVTFPMEWYSAAAGSTVSIPVTGWSTAPTTDWLVRTYVPGRGNASLTWNAQITGTATTTIAGMTYKVLNNGKRGTLSVTVPAAAQSGDWASFLVRSFRLDSSGDAPAGEDYHHGSMVGVYVK